MTRRIETFLHRHAILCALCCALMMVVAAPYLIPENPDSATFRSGTLGFILLCACALPVCHALRRHTLRAIAYGCLFAWIFALCLGLGSELTAYDGLLPGMGSAVRRLAVPFLAAPYLGALASFLFAAHPLRQRSERKAIPFAAFFALFALCYGLVLLALFPGVISYDFEHEIAQFTTGAYDAAHPVFHTLFLGSLYALGERLLGSMTAGAVLYSLVQLLILAALYAYACTFVQRRVPRAVTLALAACFALLPFHGVLAVSTAKDPLFGGLSVLLCLSLWEMAEDPDAFLHSRRKCARLTLVSLFMCLLRHNALFAVIPACLAAAILCRNLRLKALRLCALALACCLLIPQALVFAVDAQKVPSSELMSVPCQQLMRTAARANISDEEYEELSAWFSGEVQRYRPHCADPAKGGNFDLERYQEDPGAFFAMYLRYGAAYPRIYLEAFLENSVGLWNPDDLSHAHALSTEEYDYIYLNTVYSYDSDRYPIVSNSLLPPLQRMLYAFTHHSVQQRYPLLAQLFCPATYSFLCLLCALLLLCRRQGRFTLCLMPMAGLFISILFSAGVFVRYAYPLMACAPVLLTLSLARPAPEDVA